MAIRKTARYALHPWSFAAAVGLVLFVVLLRPPTKTVPPGSDWYPQNQDCQLDSAAFQVRFPYKRKFYNLEPLISDPEAKPRAVTNCRRFGFNFFLQTSEVTHLQYWSQSRDKFYATNGNGQRDLIVHVSHVQPATSLLDSTLATNHYFLAAAKELQIAYTKFDGVRQSLDGYSLDSFYPYLYRRTDQFYFLSKMDTKPELVGRCDGTSELKGTCYILLFSERDGFAFEIRIPQRELYQLDLILERSLTLLRQWRVPNT